MKIYEGRGTKLTTQTDPYPSVSNFTVLIGNLKLLMGNSKRLASTQGIMATSMDKKQRLV
jgi:hypothetical protein